METTHPTKRGLAEKLSSPRAQRRIMLGSGAVFVAGLALFLSLVVLRGSPGYKAPISTLPAQTAPPQVKAKPSPEAFQVARTFLETAVLRKNLDAAYPLVNGEIKGTMSRKAWDRGNIPVIPYPAVNAKNAQFQVAWSYKTQIVFTVDLVARPGSKVRPHLLFWVGLKRAHGKPNGHWLVNYFQADWAPPVPYGGGG